MRFLKTFIFTGITSFFLFSQPYLSDDFSADISTRAEWSNNWCYGRNGQIIGYIPTTVQAMHTVVPNRLTFRGSPNSDSADFKREIDFTGKAVWLTNKFHASPEQPFGWEIIRTYEHLYPNEDPRARAQTGIAMFVDTDPPLTKAITSNGQTVGEDPVRDYEWLTVKHYFEFVNMANNFAGIYSNYPAYYDGVEHSLLTEIRALPREGRGPDVNAENVIITSSGGATRDISSNTNAVGFRMTHDGSTLTLLINPDPLEQNSHPNEWLVAAEINSISWRSNMQIMIQHAVDLPQNFNNGHLMDIDWAGLLIRSAAASSGFNFCPTPEGLALTIRNKLYPVTNAGINMVKIRVPSARPVSPVKLRSAGQELTVKAWQHGLWPAADEAAWWRENGFLYLVFGEQLRVSRLAADLKIEIELAGELKDWRPALWVKAEQFDFMPAGQKGRYSTCGWQQSSYQPRLISVNQY